MDDCSGDTVTMCGYSAAAFGTSGWRLQWGTVGEPSTDTPARPDTLAGFTIRRTLLELERHEHQPDGRFAARGQAVADALGYNEPLSAAIRIIQRCPWRPEVKNFAWELTTGCALIGRRGGANIDDCATCAAVVQHRCLECGVQWRSAGLLRAHLGMPTCWTPKTGAELSFQKQGCKHSLS